jgi:hypothetical protein
MLSHLKDCANIYRRLVAVFSNDLRLVEKADQVSEYVVRGDIERVLGYRDEERLEFNSSYFEIIKDCADIQDMKQATQTLLTHNGKPMDLKF